MWRTVTVSTRIPATVRWKHLFISLICISNKGGERTKKQTPSDCYQILMAERQQAPSDCGSNQFLVEHYDAFISTRAAIHFVLKELEE